MSRNCADLIPRARENVLALGVDELKKAGFIPRDGRYFPAVFYPPMIMYRSLGEKEFFSGRSVGRRKPFVVYAHVPFCVKKCRFCHFVSFEGIPPGEKDAYLDAMEREIGLYRERLQLERIPAGAVNIGGGTATCLSPRQLDRFLGFFTAGLDLGACEQFTVDVDVSTLLGPTGRERLKILRSRGVDRVTIGAQVFDNVILKDMNRPNMGEDVCEAVGNARAAGIDNICIDLIYGYPGQTPENWADTLERTVSLDIESFQIYRLRIKPHYLLPGSIAERYARSPGDFPSLEEVYVMKELAYLTAEKKGLDDSHCTSLFSRSDRGISRYIRKKFCELHDVLGFGISANNVLGGNIGIKTGDLGEYCARVGEGIVPMATGKRCTPDDIARRTVIGPLRNRSRIDGDFFRERTGLDMGETFGGTIGKLQDHDILAKEEGGFRLTKRGHFFVDAACIQFYHPDFVPFPEEDYAAGVLSPYNQPGGGNDE